MFHLVVMFSVAVYVSTQLAQPARLAALPLVKQCCDPQLLLLMFMHSCS